MALYIRSAQSISPQNTFPGKDIPEEINLYTDKLKCMLPDFKNYFAPLERRRMSRIIKMGVACAEEAIREAEIEKPDAIISGTGLGCVEDTEKFLNNVLTSEEGLLTPTAFVQSTHNSIGASISLKYKCKGYNVLYAHKTTSFESALLDASLLMKEEARKILVGGFDEITQENYELKKKVGLFKTESCTNLDIKKSKTSGCIPGEGTTYFMISNEESINNYAQIKLVNFTHRLKDITQVKEWISKTLYKSELKAEDIDNLIVGVNGDINGDKIYYDLIDQMFNSSNSLYFKHLCGEYDSATAFGMWLSAKMLKSNLLADSLILHNNNKPLRNILIYNQDTFNNHSLILLSKV
jgi:3-oxoacyl-(acyl-carrier-protein) synthase